MPAGKATVRFEFAYDGGGLGRGGTGTVLVNGEKVAQGRIDRTQGMAFSADEGADVGMIRDAGVGDYKAGDNRFTGTIRKIVLEVGPLRLGAADGEKIPTGSRRTQGGGVNPARHSVRAGLAGRDCDRAAVKPSVGKPPHESGHESLTDEGDDSRRTRTSLAAAAVSRLATVSGRLPPSLGQDKS